MGKFKPTSDNTIGRHARKAAQIIEERGWARGVEENFAGQVCLTGAFRRAVSPMPKPQGATLRGMFSTRFAQWMRDHHPDPAHNRAGEAVNPADLYSAPAWNDSIFKTKEETLAWLNKFADDLDPQR